MKTGFHGTLGSPFGSATVSIPTYTLMPTNVMSEYGFETCHITANFCIERLSVLLRKSNFGNIAQI